MIAGRYEIRGELGRGGMAVVYRVMDSTNGRELALKQLRVQPTEHTFAESSARFEREFHTLLQLSHPRIIEVYDYGLDASGPYYTMELLDGGDLIERSPLPWREACTLLHDVCSSLALLHSRRFVHCDVSPRNVRCTQDGRAKLIDFGAMVPMSRGAMVVGTPSFVAPEVVFRSDLDARTDLYSLGATLYYAVTGRVAYPARDFAQLIDALRVKPPPASHYTPDVPAALDALLLSLLSVEAAERPRSAFEVMQRLAALAGIERDESADVSQAYLSAPSLIGREVWMEMIRRELRHAFAGRSRSFLLRGASGLGRSRMLDACVIAAKMIGFSVARGGADATRTVDFAVAQDLLQQLLDGSPDLALETAQSEGGFDTLFEGDAVTPNTPNASRNPARPRVRNLAETGLPRAQVQAALCGLIEALAKAQPIIIAVDDLQRIDEPSASLLATLVSRATERRLFVLVTLEAGAASNAPTACEVIAQHARICELAALTPPETTALLSSVFGDVQNLGLVSYGIHTAAAGNPRICLELARHLIDSGRVRYDAGCWMLPSELEATDLPASAEGALQARVAGLTPLARHLLEAQALASHGAFTREDYALLSPGIDSGQLDQAISELVTREFLVGDGRMYSLAHQSWAASLTAHISAQDQRARHTAIAGLYAGSVKALGHLFAAGEPERGLDELFKFVGAQGDDSVRAFTSLQTNVGELTRLFSQALAAAEQLGRSARQRTELRRWLASCAPTFDDEAFWTAAPAWLDQLRHDSGLALWEQSAEITDPGARLTKALQTAFERYNATPEAERVYRPDEAIRYLVTYVVVSIAVGARSADPALLCTLPELLEPFVPLSPAVAVIQQNALATREYLAYAQPERARLRWLEVYEKLGAMPASAMEYLDLIRSAVGSGIGFVESSMGLPSAETWAERIAHDEFQAMQALYLRKTARLQQGDWEGAERFRKQAELSALQTRGRSMFTASIVYELDAHAMAGDLTGVKQIKDRIDALVERARGWTSIQHVAEGWHRRLVGQLDAACAAFERGLQLTAPNPQDSSRNIQHWPAVLEGYIGTLVDKGCYGEARALGEQALAECALRGIDVAAHRVRRELALAEAKLGLFDQAAARLEALIEAQLTLGVTGLHLGAAYEARARVALCAHDEEGVIKYGRLTARQYRHGAGSPLGARYERLMDEARAAFPDGSAQLAELDLANASRTLAARETASSRAVTQVFRRATDAQARAELALSLLCESRGTQRGYLYVVRDGGLALAASQGGRPPSEELAALAQSHLQRTTEQMDMPTQVATGHELSVAESRSVIDAAGAVYEPTLLSCSAKGTLWYVGIALLIMDERRPAQHEDPMFVTAIAQQLLAAGDVPGLAAASNAN